MAMVFDAHKRRVLVSDIYPEHADLKKGDYMARVCLRHDNVALLEKLRDVVLVLERRLPTPVDVPLHATLPEALSGGKAFKGQAMHRGERVKFFAGMPPWDKLPKDAAEGRVMTGTLKWGPSDQPLGKAGLRYTGEAGGTAVRVSSHAPHGSQGVHGPRCPRSASRAQEARRGRGWGRPRCLGEGGEGAEGGHAGRQGLLPQGPGPGRRRPGGAARVALRRGAPGVPQPPAPAAGEAVGRAQAGQRGPGGTGERQPWRGCVCNLGDMRRVGAGDAHRAPLSRRRRPGR